MLHVCALSFWDSEFPKIVARRGFPEMRKEPAGCHLRRYPSASTTDRYTKSAGLYTDQEEIVTALGDSGIGQVVGDLLKKEIPQEGPVLEGL